MTLIRGSPESPASPLCIEFWKMMEAQNKKESTRLAGHKASHSQNTFSKATSGFGSDKT